MVVSISGLVISVVVITGGRVNGRLVVVLKYRGSPGVCQGGRVVLVLVPGILDVSISPMVVVVIGGGRGNGRLVVVFMYRGSPGVCQGGRVVLLVTGDSNVSPVIR